MTVPDRPWIGTRPVGQRFAILTTMAGGLVSAAAVAGGRIALALAIFVGFGLIGLLGLVPGELSRARKDLADERQRSMIFESIAVSDYIVRPVILVGAVVEAYRGTPGPFTLIAGLKSIAEIGAVLVLPPRR